MKNSKILIHAEKQPITNRFLINPNEQETLYDLTLVQSQKSGLIRLQHEIPVEELVPKFCWITYFEPEDHLDRMVEELMNGFGQNHDTVCVGGISYKDDTTLARFSKKYSANTWRLNPKSDLGIEEAGAGVESIQYYLNETRAKEIKEKYPPADLLIVRHIYEHCYDLNSFSDALKSLIKPNGYIVFEIPDASRLIQACDYTLVWEEHLLYFTPFTFKNTLAEMGFRINRFFQYPYPFEDSLVAVVQVQAEKSIPDIDQKQLDQAIKQGALFSDNFKKQKQEIRNFLSSFFKKHGKIAIFGAGHLTATFIALFELEKWISCVLDDNPNKEGLFMPYAKIPIFSSSHMYEENIQLCLLGINPIHENKVIGKHKQFVNKGGEMLSIFPSSAISLQKRLCL
jgi:hypothetical protein